MKKYPAVIFIGTIALLSLYWLFFYIPEVEVIQLQVSEQMKFRNSVVLKPAGKMELKEETIRIISDSNYLYLLPYDIEKASFLVRKIDLLGKEIWMMPSPGKTAGVSPLGLKFYQNKFCVLCHIDTTLRIFSFYSDNTSDTLQFNIQTSYEIDYNDSIIVYGQQVGDKFFIKRLNYITNQRDSLDLNSIFNSNDKELNVVYGGRNLILDSRILYKSLYSSVGVMIENDFKHYKVINAIDSIPLPKIKRVKLAEGIFSIEAYPEVYPTWQILNDDDKFYILSMLSKKDNARFIDVYDDNFVYQKSFELPFLDEKFQPYCFQLSKNKKSLYVLYDDYLTIQTFNFNK